MKNNDNKKPIRKSLKPCAEFGCGKLTRKTYCKIHEKNAQETTRFYNSYSRDPVIEAFYHTGEWRRLRMVAMRRDLFLCVRCRNKNKLVKADLVHHIIEIRDDWSLRLTLSNLESICHSCHNSHHKRSPRGSEILKRNIK